MNNKLAALYCILLISIFYACSSEEFSIDDIVSSKNNHQFDVVVDCYITTELKKHYIKLIKPSDDFTGNKSDPVSGAIVYIINEDNEYYFEESKIPGIYESTIEFAPQVGQEYEMHVKVGNMEYFACEMPVAVRDIDSSQIQLAKRDMGVISSSRTYFLVDKHQFGYPENNKWLWLDDIPLEYFSNPFSENLYHCYTHSRAELQGLYPNNIYLYSFRGSPEDSITIMKYSLSDNYYEYLIALFSETEWEAGIFSSIPGNLPSNLSEGGAGYFYIMDVTSKKITVNELLKQVNN